MVKLLQEVPQINGQKAAFCCLIIMMSVCIFFEAESLVVHTGLELAM